MNRRTNFSLHVTEISLLPNVWSFMCIGVIFVAAYVLNSNFILMPGLSIDLPTAESTTYANVDNVLQIQSNDFMLFDEEFLSIKTLPAALKRSLVNSKNHDSCLLIIVDKTIQLENFIQICDIAKSAGYNNLHLATSKKLPDEK